MHLSLYARAKLAELLCILALQRLSHKLLMFVLLNSGFGEPCVFTTAALHFLHKKSNGLKRFMIMWLDLHVPHLGILCARHRRQERTISSPVLEVHWIQW